MDFHTALYHCREIEKHFEEMNEEEKGLECARSLVGPKCEEHLCMGLEQVLASLKALENSVQVKDEVSILGFENLVDDMVDYFDCLIADLERNGAAGQKGIRMRKLRSCRESAGKLAQLLCQSSE